MKKWMSLLLILALTVPALTSCRRGQKSDAPEATATPQPGGAGPGYTITDSDTVPSVPDPLSASVVVPPPLLPPLFLFTHARMPKNNTATTIRIPPPNMK